MHDSIQNISSALNLLPRLRKFNFSPLLDKIVRSLFVFKEVKRFSATTDFRPQVNRKLCFCANARRCSKCGKNSETPPEISEELHRSIEILVLRRGVNLQK